MMTQSSLQVPDQKAQLDSPLDLTIRFTISHPDFQISLQSTRDATTATLKQLIRKALPDELKNRRIRLIYAGKFLADDTLVNVSLRRTLSHPPTRTSTPGPQDDASKTNKKSKGKEPVHDPPPPSRTYIHCSIGDEDLTPQDLAAEANLADSKRDENSTTTGLTSNGQNTTTTTPMPRGFDRLLAAGFSAQEVQNLRIQFRAVQRHTHTPENMPSPSTMRDLEEQWLDNSSENGGRSGMGGTEDAAAGSLDDMLLGAATGFFWPVGCLFWGVKEEGVWSQRRKMAVVVGVLLNCALGFVRYTN